MGVSFLSYLFDDIIIGQGSSNSSADSELREVDDDFDGAQSN